MALAFPAAQPKPMNNTAAASPPHSSASTPPGRLWFPYVEDLTGRAPAIFEPARPADTGSYAGPALGYGVAGAWGNLNLPFQVFVQARRPAPAGIATIAGYGTPGPLARATLSDAGGQVTDTDIYAAITSVMPTASIAWTSITN